MASCPWCRAFREAREKRRAAGAEAVEAQRREFDERVKKGEVDEPLEMAVSHTYDFEERPEGIGDLEPPLFCVIEQRVGHVSYVGQPNWDDWTELRSLWDVYLITPGDEDFLGLIRRSHLMRAFGEADLSVSAALDQEMDEALDDDEVFMSRGMPRTQPTRELSWDGEVLRLPTGHWCANLIGPHVWAWWEWDNLKPRGGREILKAGAPAAVDTLKLRIRDFVTRDHIHQKDKWANAHDLEAVLVEDLRMVRARMASAEADLSDPRAVYEIGERVLDEHTKARAAWRRFAAFVESGTA